MANIKLILLSLALAAGLAGAVPTDVFVYVVNESGKLPGIEGANVTIECGNQSNTTISGGKGFYYGTLNCTENETVRATAQEGNQTGSNSGIVTVTNGYGSVIITIMLPGGQGTGPCPLGQGSCTQIPEFPIAAAPVLLSVLSFGLLRLRKR